MIKSRTRENFLACKSEGEYFGGKGHGRYQSQTFAVIAAVVVCICLIKREHGFKEETNSKILGKVS
jgi:DNA invertase Pin-like site-specific DNA recombinase